MEKADSSDDDRAKQKQQQPDQVSRKLKRALPEGNHAVSYCWEAASQIKQEEMPAENPFAGLLG